MDNGCIDDESHLGVYERSEPERGLFPIQSESFFDINPREGRDPFWGLFQDRAPWLRETESGKVIKERDRAQQQQQKRDKRSAEHFF